MGRWTEDDAEVMAAAKALAAYYDGTDEDAETWVAGAVVALNATNCRGAVEALRYIAGEDVAGMEGHLAPRIVAGMALAAMGVEPYASRHGGGTTRLTADAGPDRQDA